MDGYGYVNDDDDGDDDDDEIAPDAKVSFFSVLWSPCKMFEKWQQRGPAQMPGTLFFNCVVFLQRKLFFLDAME